MAKMQEPVNSHLLGEAKRNRKLAVWLKRYCLLVCWQCQWIIRIHRKNKANEQYNRNCVSAYIVYCPRLELSPRSLLAMCPLNC